MDSNNPLCDTMPGWAQQANHPVTYSRMLADIVESYDISQERLLMHAGLNPNALLDPSGRISLVNGLKLIDAALELTGDPLIGFKSGLSTPITAHGSLGYALMCAPTPRKAIEVMQRFWHLRGRGVLVTITEQQEQLFVELVPEVPVSDQVRDAMFSSMLASVFQGMRFVLPEITGGSEIWLKNAKPDGFAEIESKLPLVRFEMQSMGLNFIGDLSWIDKDLPTANAESFAQAISQCERESALIDVENNVLQQARASMELSNDGYPSPDEIADKLHMTPRTFRRRLHEHGYSYKQLLEDARRRDSCQLLSRSNLDISRISEQLGYADPANFTRAFKTWTGITPSQWRQR